MPEALAALLLSIGCAVAQFEGPSGPFNVWVCPPVVVVEAPKVPEEKL